MVRLSRTIYVAALSVLSLVSAASAQEVGRGTIPVKRSLANEPTLKSRSKTVVATLNQKLDLAFKGEDKLKAAIQADIQAIRAEKNPDTQARLVKTFRSKYAKDLQRVVGKANIDLQAAARDLQTAAPDMTFKVVGMQVVGTLTPTDPAPPEPPAPAPTPTDTVKELVGSDYGFVRESDCGTGEGDSTRSGGYVTSRAEGCETTGEMTYELVVPSDKKARVEITGDLSAEAHAIFGSSMGVSSISVMRLSDKVEVMGEVAIASAYSLAGDDGLMDVNNIALNRTLPAGRYRLTARTNAWSLDYVVGWSTASARVKTLRVKITTSPK